MLTCTSMCGYILYMINLDDRFYTSTEVAEILGVSLRSIYRYLEESKIQAEVQTATGRHRFTRQNIIDFLYPNQRAQQNQQQGYPMQNQQQVPQYQIPQTYSQQPSSNSGFSTTPQQQSYQQAPQDNNPQAQVDIPTQPVPEASAQINIQFGQPVADSTTQANHSTQNDPVQDTVSTDVQSAEPVVQNNVNESSNIDTSSNQEEPQTPATTDSNNNTETNQVDWLTKFKEAAEKYKQEQAQKENTPASNNNPVNSTPVSDPTSNQTHVSPQPTAPTAPQTVPVNQVNNDSSKEEVKTTSVSSTSSSKSPSEGYYRSSLGGLKDIAQSIDKSAKKSSLPYAFTMMAGLSLHRPIKPFSLLHVYVRPEDQAFYEKSLQLVQSGKENAQLCLKFTSDANVYSSATELHGLSVVSNDRLKKDLNDAGESSLANEL